MYLFNRSLSIIRTNFLRINFLIVNQKQGFVNPYGPCSCSLMASEFVEEKFRQKKLTKLNRKFKDFLFI
jgi:hypothetical protein